MLTIYLSMAAAIFVYIYWLIPNRLRNLFIGLTNIGFLYWLGINSLLLYLFLVALTLLATRRIAESESDEKTKRHIWLSIAAIGSLGAIFAFKAWGLQDSAKTSAWMPIGLSYFSLMLLGYTIDVYRKTITPQIRDGSLFLFSSFFPIVAVGPIERHHRLARQFLEPKVWDNVRAAEGANLIALGLFKKFVIADRLSDFIVDPDRHSLSLQGFELWYFISLSLIQIFCDFSGLIDIVRGFSKLLGFGVIDNFNQPYFARSIPDIWRRWHISLVDWLRDFVYNPIALQTRNLYLAALAVMIGVGLWHEVSLKGIAWATYWYVLYCLSIFIRRRGWRINLFKPLKIVGVLLLMAISTLFFLPSSLGDFNTLAGNLINFSNTMNGEFFHRVSLSRNDAIISLAGFFAVVLIETGHRRLFPVLVQKPKKILLFYSIAALLFVVTIMFGHGSSKAFIYLRY